MKKIVIGSIISIANLILILILKILNLLNEYTLVLVLAIFVVGVVIKWLGVISLKPPHFFANVESVGKPDTTNDE